MKIRILLTVVVSTLLLLPSYGFAQRGRQDPRDLIALANFKNALDRDGFDVSTGDTTIINPVASWCAGTPIPGYDTALYANNQPYLQLLVSKSAQDASLTANFQLGRDEAIVLIGRTPPSERYFGFHAFLKTKVDPDGKKQPLWATIGDTVNNLTVKTTGSSPFNSPVALIFTPDQGTDARVRKALERAGYPAAIINTVVFPASMLSLGHGDAADELFIALRNAIWQNRADGDAYIQNPPLHLYRVTPRAETIANPFPVPRLRVRGTGQTEMDLMNKLGQLRQGIIAVNPLFPTDLTTEAILYESYDAIQRGVDPLGDSRDPLWLAAGYLPEWGLMGEVTLADDEFLMIYGVNHAATGKASYHSFNVYSSSTMEGKVPIGGADDTAFPGTATPYLPPGDPAGNLMYAYKVSRNCGQEPNCVQLAIADCPRLTIGPNTVLGIFFRMYLEPATKVGPAMPEILYDRVIKFSPRP